MSRGLLRYHVTWFVEISFVLVGETNKTANIGSLYPSNKSSLENLYRIGNRIKSVNVSPKKEKS